PARTQRLLIQQHLSNLENANDVSHAMTISLPTASLKKLLPSLDEKTRTIDLSDVLQLISQNSRGTEFYANGKATLNRLAVQANVQEIISSIKQGEKK